MYFVFSILQRRAVNVQSSLMMKRSKFKESAKALELINPPMLDKFLTKLGTSSFISNPTADERVLLKLMNSIEMVSSKVKGSLQSKKAKRSMIQAVIR